MIAITMTHTHTQKVKVSSRLVQKWKQTDRRTDGGDCITCRANAVSKYRPKHASVQLCSLASQAVRYELQLSMSLSVMMFRSKTVASSIGYPCQDDRRCVRHFVGGECVCVCALNEIQLERSVAKLVDTYS